MEDVFTIIFLSTTVFIGSFLSGLIPLSLALSESKMRFITILGAGLLIGTAFTVIIPEGVLALTSSSSDPHAHTNRHKRNTVYDLKQTRANVLTTFHSALQYRNEHVRFQLTPNTLTSKSTKSHGIKEIENDSASFQHDKLSHGDSHQTIGISLVIGFVFMLVIDQIGGKLSHRHAQVIDVQAVKNKITFVTTLGLVVHSAADGIALGAAATTSKTDVEMIVFAAIMLHKAPAAFGLVSFLIHEGLDRLRVRHHLIVFATAAPFMAILTFSILKLQSDSRSVETSSTGVAMLFSAGTFLYVSTVHVLPEVQSHNDDKQFKFGETVTFVLGTLMPLVLSLGHTH